MSEVRTLLKRDESYAIHALVTVSKNPGIATAELAEQLQLPPAFTAKVVRKLVKKEFLRSVMGRGGGLMLAVDLQDVTMLDVIEAVSGPLILDTCQTRQQCATQQRCGYCGIKPAWFAGTKQIRGILAQYRLSDLAAPPPP